MRSFLVLALLLAGAPAWADGELIRFRQADGTLGLVDDDDKLPPGAVVLERTPLRRPAEPAEPVAPAASDPALAEGVGAAAQDESAREHRPGRLIIEPRRSPAPAAAALADDVPLDAEAARENEKLCSRYYLDSDCTENDRQVAAGWCQRSTEVRGLLERAEEELELAQEEFDRCDALSGSYYCSRIRLDAALSSHAKEEVAVERLENECRKEDCLPGWTREGCEP
jgi:hypothetical protein